MEQKVEKLPTGIRKHGNRYEWKFRLHGETFRGSEPTLKEAVSAMAAARVDVAKGAFIAPSKMTLAEYYENEYLPSIGRGLKESTIKNYQDLWAARVAPHLGSLTLPMITEGRISKWVTLLEEQGGKRGPLSSTSIVHAFTFLRAVLSHAVSHKKLPQNPCATMQHPPTREENKEGRDWWDTETIREFLSDPLVTGHRIFPMVVFLFDTGVRRGELCGLRWSSVDLEAGTVTIERSRVRVIGLAVVDGVPKGRKNQKPKIRTLSLSEPAVVVLRQWRKAQLEERLRIGAAWRGEDFVFTTPVQGPGSTSGGSYSPEGASRAWIRLRDRWLAQQAAAGVTGPNGKSLPAPSIHEVRHSSISAAVVSGGIDILTVAKRAGHSDARMISSIYGHVSEEADREAANKVAGILYAPQHGNRAAGSE